MLTVLKSQDRNRVEEVRAADLFREKQKLTQNQNYPLLRLYNNNNNNDNN